MALIHRAQLTPTKRELIAGWLPTRPWSGNRAAGQVELIGAYRFDDPSGVVGIETLLVRTGGALTRALALDHHHLSSSPAAPMLTAGHSSAS